jgi:hypothetical protein
MNKFVFCIGFCSLIAHAQQVYLGMDKNGVPLYSDKPVPGAQKIELKVALQSLSPQQATTIQPLAPLEQNQTDYQLSIQSPADQESLLSNQGEVLVEVAVKPELVDQHQLRLVFNQSQQSPLQKGTNFRLLGVERGEHQVQIQVIDQNGKLIAESPVTTFYLRKTTVASPK